MNYLTKEVISDYFSLLIDILTENNLFELNVLVNSTMLMKQESLWMAMPQGLWLRGAGPKES